MRLSVCIISLTASLALPAFSQSPVDTTLVMGDVEVVGGRFAGLSSADGIRRLRVEENISAVTHTASELLRQLPSVITDIEGDVVFRGSGDVGMAINGVPYGMLEEYSGDLLIQLPALFFDRLSLGSFPSVKVIPDGDTGMLDMLPRRFRADESPLHLTLGAGWNERYNAGALLNLHPGRFHINAKYNYRREFRERSFSKSTATPKNRTEMVNNASARPDVHLAELSVGYDITPSDRVYVSGLYYLMDYDRYGRINNRVFNPQGKQMKYVIRNRYNDQRQDAYSVEAGWEHDLSNDGRLHARFNYNNFSYDEGNEFKNENPENGKIVAEESSLFNQDKHSYFWEVGYESRIDDWGFALGYIGRLRQEDFITKAWNRVDGDFVLNRANSYGYDFSRLLNMLYLSVARRWGAFGVEAGAQAELSSTSMYGNSSSRFHLYPRVRFTFDDRWENRLSLTYQQRVIRPLGSYLCSFINRSDATHLAEGNPGLKDEIIHSLELAYRIDVSRVSIMPAVYFRDRANRIVEVARQQDEETIWRRENVGHSRTVGADLSALWSPLRILSFGLSADIYRDEIDGRGIGFGERKSLVCWDIKGNANLRITPTTELQLDGFYVSDRLTPQGRVEGRYCVNAGVSQYFMDGRLRANLSVNNLFDSLEEVTVIDTPSLGMTQRRDRDARAAWLTLTYRM